MAKASTAAILRRLADWLEQHPDAESTLTGISLTPVLDTTHVNLEGQEVLKAAFAGRGSATVERVADYDVLTVVDDGIVFQGWEVVGRSIPSHTVQL